MCSDRDIHERLPSQHRGQPALRRNDDDGARAWRLLRQPTATQEGSSYRRLEWDLELQCFRYLDKPQKKFSIDRLPVRAEPLRTRRALPRRHRVFSTQAAAWWTRAAPRPPTWPAIGAAYGTIAAAPSPPAADNAKTSSSEQS